MPTDTYDVVIAGSGLGGLLSAVILAKEGIKVCVLEQDKQIGGCLQTFSLHKKVFDSCVHYIGGLGEGHTLWHIFKYAGIIDQLSLKPYNKDSFDKIALADDPLLYPQAVGSDNFIEQLSLYFPNERQALRQYIKIIQQAGDHFPLYRLRNGDANEKSVVSSWEVTKTLENITSNTRLQQVLAGNNFLYAGAAGKTPFYLHALVLESYIHSTHKILPGSSQIAKLLWKQLQAHGGEIHRNTTIVKLKEAHGTITYAESAEGKRFYGKQFIANIAPKALLRIIDSDVIRPAYRKRINTLEQTTSCFMVNAVLKSKAVAFRDYNIYWNASYNSWEAINYLPKDWPANYAVFFNEDATHKGYAESVSILSYMHYEEVSKWADTVNRAGNEKERGADYEIFKAQKTEKLLTKVYDRLPELKGNIIAQSAATPLSYRDYTGTPEGALYGIFKDVNRPSETTIATRSRIPNLYFTGQNVNLHGVLGVSITAIATCAEITGMDYLLGKIKGI